MSNYPILQLLNMVPGVIHATASIDRLCELEIEKGIRVHPCIPCQNKNIRFDDVSFRYAKGDREILSHFTHEFKAGSKTAIMGETGIGKTTMFRLILGFIEPTAGKVEVGGELYHRLFTTYPQKTMLFITHRTTVSELCDELIKM